MPESLFRRILVPYDFSPQATVALKTPTQLAKQHNGKLTVLHVVMPFYLPVDVPLGMTPPGDVVPELRGYLQRVVTQTVGKGGPSVIVQVKMGVAAERIIGAARRADSIVMATSGRTGLAHFLIGSVAEKVVRHATVPVLTLRVPIRRRSPPRKKRGRV